MWWKKSYINRRDWLLENYAVLGFAPNQMIIILMLDFMNTNNLEVNLESLAKRCNMEIDEVDTILQGLIQSEMVRVNVLSSGIAFNLDNIFENGLSYENISQDIFEVFEQELGRLLSQNELMTLNTWLGKYTEDDIIDALRSAIIYQKVSMPYINSILANKQKEKALSYEG